MPFSMEIVRRRKVAGVAPRPRRHYISRKQLVIRSAPPPPPPLIDVMIYVLPAMLALLALQHQPHPAPLWCFVAATTAYWLIVGAMKRRKTMKWFRTLGRAALASGILSALALLLMLLPPPVSLLPLFIWLLFVLIWVIYRSPIIAKIKAFAHRARDKGLSSGNQNLPV